MTANQHTSQLGCAVLTVSDSRGLAEDTSGALLIELLEADGHRLVARELVRDDRFQVRAVVSRWIADPAVDVVITTGGTGFTGRDTTPEALLPLLEKPIEGFGELFRALSYEEIGTSTIQSRALGGLSNGTLVFCLPGSRNACRTAWTRILTSQLNVSHRPCNFVELIPRFKEV
ncbi:MAG: molybdenum cofactor biosynthesis protein B [Gammaproteobacteria bacterium]|nr:molybdenum cofactor biosynthesis protein B [Gammaproteobacteria bacterium]